MRSRGAFPAGQVKRVDLLLELERAGQRVQQEVAGPEVACGGPDAPAGSARARCSTAGTSRRGSASCATAGAAVPGPGEPRPGMYPSRDHARPARAACCGRGAGQCRFPRAASPQARPRTSRTGCQRSAERWPTRTGAHEPRKPASTTANGTVKNRLILPPFHGDRDILAGIPTRRSLARVHVRCGTCAARVESLRARVQGGGHLEWS